MADNTPVGVTAYIELIGPAFCATPIAALFTFWLLKTLHKQPVGSAAGHPLLDMLAKQIKDGSKAFLKEEYGYLAKFVFILGIILLVIFTFEKSALKLQGIKAMFAFYMGAGLSALAGWTGMMVATDGNVRTTVACVKGSLNDGLKVAFNTGAIMGFTVVSLGLGGLCITMLVIGASADYTFKNSLDVLASFGFGASSVALFARVAGGIYTKAADVGADLVGKIEVGIPEDDPHNPAVIADNVGDNVGDVAGMGADLFESYVGSIIACATLATNDGEIVLPFYLAGAGIICSIFGYFLVSTKEKGEGWNSNLSGLMWALEKGIFGSSLLFIGAAALICHWLDDPNVAGYDLKVPDSWGNFACIVIGLFCGLLIGKVTEYFTSFDFAPVKSIKNAGQTGPATVVIQGLGVGMLSTVPPVFILVLTILGCHFIKGVYGVSIAAVGMLATLGITLATDAYGPVADNAGGLAEMDPSVPEAVRGKTDALDALGNTTAATGKGFAIGSAVLTSLSLLAAFKAQAGMVDAELSIADPVILSGVLFGAMLPYMFAALTMISVGKAAAEIIQEVRRQFKEDPRLMECIQKMNRGEKLTPEEDVLPDSDRCVAISTASSVREMVAPGVYAIVAPLFIGLLIGPRCLMGMLSGAISSGCLVAIMMSNAGGAWDNGKKLCEKLDIKKTEQGKACIVGDTVGDPFKDTSGPALNILIKLMSMVSLTIAPLIKGRKDFESFEYGFIPLGIFVVVSAILVMKGILTWKDPLGEFQNSEAVVQPAGASPTKDAAGHVAVPITPAPHGENPIHTHTVAEQMAEVAAEQKEDANKQCKQS